MYTVCVCERVNISLNVNGRQGPCFVLCAAARCIDSSRHSSFSCATHSLPVLYEPSPSMSAFLILSPSVALVSQSTLRAERPTDTWRLQHGCLFRPENLKWGTAASLWEALAHLKPGGRISRSPTKKCHFCHLCTFMLFWTCLHFFYFFYCVFYVMNVHLRLESRSRIEKVA